MPTYDYQCKTCDNVFEIDQSIKDDKLIEFLCPICNSNQPVVRIITSMNFVLKGRGWAADGYVDTYKQTLDQM